MEHLYPKLTLLICLLVNITVLQSQNNSPLLVSDNAEQFISSFSKANKTNKQESNTEIKVSANETLTLYSNVRKQEGKTLTLIGSVNQNKNSSYYMTYSNGKLEGDIIQIDKMSAYKIFTSADSKVYIEETDINSIICIGLPILEGSSNQKPEKKSNTGVFLPPPILESRSSADAVIYLDFDGEVVTGGRWNNGDTVNAESINYFPFEIIEIWEIIAEDFSPFNVNVTTDRSVYDATPINRRIMTIFTDTNTAAPSGNGAAFLDSFNDMTDDPCWAFQSFFANKHTADTASHEIGHTMGLFHDGQESDYYEGHNEWSSIMGVGNTSLVQWSKGEYRNATNTEDDVQIIAGPKNKFGFAPDDHGNTANTATDLIADTEGNVSSTENSGIIEKRSDVDIFSFLSRTGEASFTVIPNQENPNLDIKMRLLDENENEIAVSDPSESLSATITVTIPAGFYYLEIQGTGKGTPDTGYSDYGSLGQFSISGTYARVSSESALKEVLEDSRSPFGSNNANETKVIAAELAVINGITGVDPAKETAYQIRIAGAEFSDPLTLSQVQEVIDLANDNINAFMLGKVLEDSKSPGGNENEDDIAVTAAQLALITGISNIKAVNELAYQEAIAAKADFSNLPSLNQVQFIITSVNAAESDAALKEVLEDSGPPLGSENANILPVTAVQLAAITGIKRVNPANELVYQSLITTSITFNISLTVDEVQTIIDAANLVASREALEEVLEDSASLSGHSNTNGIPVTALQLAGIFDIAAVDPANQAAYQAAIKTETSFSDLPTVNQLQTIIDGVNAAIVSSESALKEVLEDSQLPFGSGNANKTKVRATQLAAIYGITAVDPTKEASYQLAIQFWSAFSNPLTVNQVQAVIDYVNTAFSGTALEKVLEDSKSPGGKENEDDTKVTAAQLAEITGITAVYPWQESAYQAAIAAETGFSNPPTLEEVQAIIDDINLAAVLAEVLEDSATILGGAKNLNKLAVTASQLASISEITDVRPANQTGYQAAIAAEINFSNPPTVAHVQEIITTVNILYEVLEDSVSPGGEDNKNGFAVTTTTLAQISGITDVVYANQAAYQVAIAAVTDFDTPPTLEHVQGIINAVNEAESDDALVKVFEYSNSPGSGDANGIPLTVRQLAVISGIKDVIPANESAYQATIRAGTNFSNPPKVKEVQDIIDAVNAAAQSCNCPQISIQVLD